MLALETEQLLRRFRCVQIFLKLQALDGAGILIMYVKTPDSDCKTATRFLL